MASLAANKTITRAGFLSLHFYLQITSACDVERVDTKAIIICFYFSFKAFLITIVY